MTSFDFLTRKISNMAGRVCAINDMVRIPCRGELKRHVAVCERTVQSLRKQIEKTQSDDLRAEYETRIERLLKHRDTKLTSSLPNRWGHVPMHPRYSGYTGIEGAETRGTRVVRRADGSYMAMDGRSLRGLFDFVVPHDDPEQVIIGSRHFTLADGKPVSYAGTCRFDERGCLVRWDNHTGHYRSHPGLAHQVSSAGAAQMPILPAERFRPRHINEVRRARLHERFDDNPDRVVVADELGVSGADLQVVCEQLGI